MLLLYAPYKKSRALYTLTSIYQRSSSSFHLTRKTSLTLDRFEKFTNIYCRHLLSIDPPIIRNESNESKFRIAFEFLHPSLSWMYRYYRSEYLQQYYPIFNNLPLNERDLFPSRTAVFQPPCVFRGFINGHPG